MKIKSKRDIRFPLRFKLMASIAVTESILLIILIVLVESHIRESVQDQFFKRGFFVARHLGTINADYITSYNYVNIRKNVDKISSEPGVSYAAVILFNEELAAYRSLNVSKTEMIDSETITWGLKTENESYRYRKIKNDEICEIVVPIKIDGEEWGKALVGFSVKQLHKSILTTRKKLIFLGIIALCISGLISKLVAGKITRPIKLLVNSMNSFSKREKTEPLDIVTSDEIGYLATRYNAMHEMLDSHINLLNYANHELKASNDKLQNEVLERTRAEREVEDQKKYLEKLVEERTCKLQDANKKLKKEVDDRKLTEEEAKKSKLDAESANKAKSLFLANMSHEIRTPMSGVLGTADLLARTNLHDHQRDYVNIIKFSGEALLSIIDDILDLSKIEAGRLELEDVDFHLIKMIENVTELFFENASRKKLELSSIIHSDVYPFVSGDSVRLRQILSNLIGNAIKFTHEGEVSLEVKTVRQFSGSVLLRFDVRDTGVGLSSHQQKKVFDSFTQADSSTTRMFGGTGLGLSICKQLVEKMDGSLGVESVKGEGANFWFTVYLKKQNRNANEYLPDVESFKGIRILSVGTGTIGKRNLNHYLSKTGIDHENIYGIDEGIEKVKKSNINGKPYDILIVGRHINLSDNKISTMITEDGSTGKSLPVLRILTRKEHTELRNSGDYSGNSFIRWPVRATDLFYSIATALNLTELAGSLSTDENDNPDDSDCKFNRKVLLADDNSTNRYVSTDMLESFGCSVNVVENGAEVIKAFREEQYDLVLMDCEMPFIDGYQATVAIRDYEEATKDDPEIAVQERTPIVALTAHAMDGVKQRCLEVGMDDYLRKPYIRNQLGAILRKWLQP